MKFKPYLVEPLPAKLYQINLYITNLSDKEMRSILDILGFATKKYPYLSYLLTDSTSEGQTSVKTVLRDGKKGRPRRRVEGGKKVPRHAHIRLLGAKIGEKNYSARKAVLYVKERLNKRFKSGSCNFTSIGNGQHAVNDITYCFRQADRYYTGGDFCFENLDCKAFCYVVKE